VQSINLERPSVSDLYWQHLAMTDLPWQNFFSKSRVWDKVPEESARIFEVTRISLKHTVGQVEGSLHAKNQLNPFSHFSRTPN